MGKKAEMLAESEIKKRKENLSDRSAPLRAQDVVKSKLSYKEKHDLEHIPKQLLTLEGAIKGLEEQLSDPQLYASNYDLFHSLTKNLDQKKAEYDALETRWLEVDEKSQNI
jgi:ATP-binding cassette subfamily F protein uup